MPGLLITGLWYLQSVPQEAYDMIVWSTGMTKDTFTLLNILGLTAFVIFAFWMVKRPKKLPLLLSFVIFGTSMAFIAEFEAVRESVRKPFIIYDYMYANGVLAKDEELYREEGYLKNSTFASVKEVTADNREEAGMELYKGQCMTCHTVDGWRDKRAFSNRLNGWNEESLASYIETLHETRPFMPPFVGTEEEKQALAHYLIKVTKQEPIVAASEGK